MRLISVQTILAIEQGIVNPGLKIIENFNDARLKGMQHPILGRRRGAAERGTRFAKVGTEDTVEI